MRMEVHCDLSRESSMDAVNWGSTRSGKCLDSQAATIMPLRVGTEMGGAGEERITWSCN
jgi:hypothetical protein